MLWISTLVGVATVLLSFATSTQAVITWAIQQAANPTADQTDAYNRIHYAMRLAVERHTRLGNATKTIRVYYDTGVPTAEANWNGDLRFGADRAYMTQRTALHEIGHTLGVGQLAAFDTHCAANNWPTATPLLQSWDGASAKINCGGGHFWPYGLNYETEWSETNADRNVLLILRMIADGMR
ncbi:hypothetical protein BKA62DRAFT_726760 [Auriculariales sp. MPI-PUGE-AT-0066]|nr:hypothetical protein BKA62DRAFT_726760 [Auriculariales sp. MPI-PUGE-AT-0066]